MYFNNLKFDILITTSKKNSLSIFKIFYIQEEKMVRIQKYIVKFAQSYIFCQTQRVETLNLFTRERCHDKSI